MQQTLQIQERTLTPADVAAISKAVLCNDFDGYTYCKLCGVNQDRPTPVHGDDCPISRLEGVL